MAIRYGLYRSMSDVTFVIIVLILLIITVIQIAGDAIVRKVTH